MFLGKDLISVDAKGRMALPARHRAAVQALCADRLVLTEHPDGNLLLMPEPKWQTFAAQFTNMPMASQWLKRIFLGSALHCELDSAARLLLSAELRSSAQITKQVLLLGAGDYFELWEPTLYAQREAKAKEAMQRELLARDQVASGITGVVL